MSKNEIEIRHRCASVRVQDDRLRINMFNPDQESRALG